MKKVTYHKLISLYPSFSFIQKIFLHLRLAVAPFDSIIPYIPDSGTIMDVGCGYGFLTNYLAFSKPNAIFLGNDLDKNRIHIASQTNLSNSRFEVLDLTKKLPTGDKYDAIILFDLLHHIDRKTQEKLIVNARKHLKRNGVLILKEISTRPRYKFYWNTIHDTIITKGQKIYCRSQKEWIQILIKEGYKIDKTTKSNKGLLYPHIMIICHKNENKQQK